MSQLKYFYLYKITNKHTGSQYIGVHETYNLDDGYMGSGTVISRAIRKYGRDSFEKSILEFFNSREDMYRRESEIVTEEFVKKHDVMNIAVGGSGGSILQNQKPFTGPHSKLTKQKLSRASKGKVASDETRQKISSNNFARKDPVAQKEHAIRAGKARWSSSEHTSHIEETKKKISESLKRWNETNVYSDDTKRKMSESQKRRREREKNLSTGKMWIYHPTERICKMISCKDDIPLGWVKGRKINFD